MISFIVNTYKRSRILVENLERLKVLGNSIEIVIVDDCSKDDTAGMLESFARRNPNLNLKIIINETNKGYSKSMNIGIENASNQDVFILNDDSFIENGEKDFAERLESDLKRYDIVATRLINEEPPSFIQQISSFFYSIPAQIFAGELYNYNKEKKRYVKYGSNAMSFNKGRIRIRFDEKNYSGNYFRIESDFQSRVRKEGFSMLFDPGLLVLHRSAKAGGLRQESKKRFLYWCIYNHLIFLRKNAGWSRYYKIPSYFLLKAVTHPIWCKTIISAFSSALKVRIK